MNGILQQVMQFLSHAGGKVTDFNDQEIKYGKKDFRNPSLILKSKHIS